MVDFFLFLLLAKMLCNLWVLVGSAIHNVHNTLKGCNTGTLWISEDRDSNFVCLVQYACMQTTPTDLQWLLPILIFAGLIFALFSFSAKYAKIRPPRKKRALQYINKLYLDLWIFSPTNNRNSNSIDATTSAAECD